MDEEGGGSGGGGGGSRTHLLSGSKTLPDDLTTTNIFISNLSPKTVEQDLINRFGKYGLLASVKIMVNRNIRPWS